MVKNINTQHKVFLGGTCNEDPWREELIPMLEVPYFNPVVDDWTEDCKHIEDIEKDKSYIELYVLTNKMTGVYSVAEAFYSACKKPHKKTILCVLRDGFTEGQLKSLDATIELFKRCNGDVCDNLREVADLCNKYLSLNPFMR